MILENQPVLLEPSSLQKHIPQDSLKQIPEHIKVCPPEVQGYDHAFCFVHCSHDPEHHHFMVTATKTTPEFDIPKQVLP